MNLVYCQYCGERIERSSFSKRPFTCFDCKAERRKEYSKTQREKSKKSPTLPTVEEWFKASFKKGHESP